MLIRRLDAANPDMEAGGAFDLVVDTYLLAHLDRPRAALALMSALLAPGGTMVLEFDDLLAKAEGGQWDVISHGHPMYLSLGWLARALEAVGLTIVDAVPQPVFGGAMRVFARAGGHPAPRSTRCWFARRRSGLGSRRVLLRSVTPSIDNAARSCRT